MTITLMTASGRTQITHLVSGLTWSGNKSTASRMLAFSLLVSAPGLNLSVRNGDHVTMDDAGVCRFAGMVVRVRQVTGSPTVSVTAYDMGIYLANNDGTYKFRDTEPADAVRRICGDYGIPYSALAVAGVRVSRKFAGVRLWQIITTLYAKAGEQTGKRYMARFIGQELQVTERTVRPTSLVIRPGSNLEQSTSERSIIKLQNSVAIYDSDGTLLQVVEDQDAVALYGLMQKHITQRDGEDAEAEARSVLEDQAETQSISVTAAGDTDVITGDTVVLRTGTGLEGICWVDSDTHQWRGGRHTMTLALNLKNVAYTADTGSDMR